MKLRIRIALGALAAIAAFGQTNGQERWVTTWATAQLLSRNAPAPPPAPNPAPQAAAAAPAAPAPAAAASGYHNQTIRLMARISLGGSRLRVRFSNAFGSAPLQIGSAHAALHAKDSEIVAGSDRALSFNGKPGCVIGPGIVMMSDPVELNAPELSDLAISIYIPGDSGAPTTHATALRTGYVSPEGDFTARAAMPEGSTAISVYHWLAGLDVLAPADAAVLVAYGDSITDGSRSTPNTNHPWPALLAARLAANKDTADVAVANLGIGGNRVLRDGTGASALARFERDVLGQAGVKWVMMLEGINDIGRWPTAPAESPSAEDLIGAYRQIIERAHAAGIKAIGCTITPYQGAGYFSDKGEEVRSAVNAWIRTGGAFDAVVDFEAAVRDAENPRRIRADFDPGDHLHPTDAGYEAMANAVDLSLFASRRAAR